jgi:hypothetical protein
MGVAVLFVSLNFRQYADVPLAYYFLAANVLLFMGDTVVGTKPGPALLAGLMTSAALWTKNEGWALLDLAGRKPLDHAARWFGYFLLGLLPLLLAALYFKISLAPPDDIVGAMSMAAVNSKLVNISRYLTILKAARSQFTHYGSLALPAIPPPVGDGHAAAAVGVRRSGGRLLLKGAARRHPGPAGRHHCRDLLHDLPADSQQPGLAAEHIPGTAGHPDSAERAVLVFFAGLCPPPPKQARKTGTENNLKRPFSTSTIAASKPPKPALAA